MWRGWTVYSAADGPRETIYSAMDDRTIYGFQEGCGGDCFWLPKLVREGDHFWHGGTTFGMGGPLLATKTGPGRGRFWQPKVVRGTTFGPDHFWRDSAPHLPVWVGGGGAFNLVLAL